MFFEGMSKPWWLAATVVWLVTLVALQELRGMDFNSAARIGLLAGAVTALVVWFAVRRLRGTPPPASSETSDPAPARPPRPSGPKRPKR